MLGQIVGCLWKGKKVRGSGGGLGGRCRVEEQACCHLV